MMMNFSAKDLFDLFTEDYEQGLFDSALQRIIPSSQTAYDSLASRESKVLPFLVNYADASVFKGAAEFQQTHEILTTLIRDDRRLNSFLPTFLELMEQEYTLFYWFMIADDEELKTTQAISKGLKNFFYNLRHRHFDALEPLYSSLPSHFEVLFRRKVQVLNGWHQFQIARPGLAQLIGGKDWMMHHPWHPFGFSQPLVVKELNPNGEVPLIFFEPLADIDLRAFLSPYIQNECIVVVETLAHFFHLLQYTGVEELWNYPCAILYILDIYPQSQFDYQNIRWSTKKTFRPIFMTDRPDIEAILPLIENALGECLVQTEWEKDTEISNWLYAIGKNFLFKCTAERYGKSRAIALDNEQGLRKWYDPHKGMPPKGALIGPSAPDYLETSLEEAARGVTRRSFTSNKRIKLAHIVPQIVDGGHAPTRLLKVLTEFADLERFELFVFSSERLAEHPLDYPIAPYSSQSSPERGGQTIRILEDRGITVAIDPSSLTSFSAAETICNRLHEHAIDIAVFHGPDAINEWSASASDVPVRVFFDHGTLPMHNCFDTYIVSTQEAYDQNQERFKHYGAAVEVLRFCIDVRQGWGERPYTKTELGLPENSFVMTTISNHLDSRLGSAMCRAIGEILQRCPEAVYAPIGEVRNPERLRALLAQYGVNERVILLGHRDNPGQIARTMNLYLNEFPFGSGLAMLDAMAAGCPVVSMYDEHGPQQARYGATYFGIDFVVKSGQTKDYVDLACRLIEDPIFYRKWSDHAIEEYEKRVDVKSYVSHFERIVGQSIQH